VINPTIVISREKPMEAQRKTHMGLSGASKKFQRKNNIS
jgi:hypothetical protein